MSAERGEVVQPQQVSRRLGHGVDVERARPRRHVAGLLRLDAVRRAWTADIRSADASAENRASKPAGARTMSSTRTSAGRKRRETAHQRQELRLRRREGYVGRRGRAHPQERRRARPGPWRARRYRCVRPPAPAPGRGTPSTAPRRARRPRCVARPARPSPRIPFRRRRCRAEDEQARHRSRWRACSCRA